MTTQTNVFEFEKKNIKYQITEDLKLNVFNFNDDINEAEPFWYQDVKPSGQPWVSADEIHEFMADYLKTR